MINRQGKEVTQDEVNQYITELRTTMNVFRALPYIVDTFALSHRDAKAAFYNWVTTFEPKEES